MHGGRAGGVKMQALARKEGEREGRGDWKINGVCDWQPMILGIRKNWISVKEAAGHDPRGARDTLILNIQGAFSLHLHPWNTRLGHKILSLLWRLTTSRVSNSNQLGRLKAAGLCSSFTGRSWQHVDRTWDGTCLSVLRPVRDVLS